MKALLPDSSRERPHNSRWDGAGRAIPTSASKVPTGGGKTLLATAAVGQVFSQWFRSATRAWCCGWCLMRRSTSRRSRPCRTVITLPAIAQRGRCGPRQGAGEEHGPSALTRQDVDSHLCVMVLMLASAARQSKETLRFFRDRGNVLGFVPREDDLPAHHGLLLLRVPNLDALCAVWHQPS